MNYYYKYKTRHTQNFTSMFNMCYKVRRHIIYDIISKETQTAKVLVSAHLCLLKQCLENIPCVIFKIFWPAFRLYMTEKTRVSKIMYSMLFVHNFVSIQMTHF